MASNLYINIRTPNSLFAGVDMDLALTGRNWSVNGSSFFCIMVIMATKPPRNFQFQDQNEWLEYDPAARFINKLPFHKCNKPVPKQCCGKTLKMYETIDPKQITKIPPIIKKWQ